ncbi:MAG: hypothetical protein C0436_02510 [Alphaproteobacteria bacterium]|nr:hypothetical protein [Alphaproteobacteria bacterium]
MNAVMLQDTLDGTMTVLLLNLMLDDDSAGYAYVAMPSDKVAGFLTGSAGEALTWPDYVKLLYQGEGEHPPEEIRAWFFDTYGFES